MSFKKTQYLNNLGVCIKSQDTTVEYQNKVCEEICGEQLGKKCTKGCILKLNAGSSEKVFNTGFKLFRNMPVDAFHVDSVIIQNGEKIVTLLMDNKEILKHQIDLIKKYDLTVSELNVMKKFLEGNTNAEIAEQLFISKSTLRTHLNNIYKKMPSELKKDILAWHHGKEKAKKS